MFDAAYDRNAQAMLAQAARFKPRWRGYPDIVATALALPCMAGLVLHARASARLAALVYGITVVLMFSVSALYHAVTWSERRLKLWQKVDHSAIYVVIAGSYTPLCLHGIGSVGGRTLLVFAWCTAIAGAAKSFFWSRAPRALSIGVYLGLGWTLLAFTSALYAGLGAEAFVWFGVGGGFFTLGACVFARRWPDPAPRAFGWHEVFHLFIMAATACHLRTMWLLLS